MRSAGAWLPSLDGLTRCMRSRVNGPLLERSIGCAAETPPGGRLPPPGTRGDRAGRTGIFPVTNKVYQIAHER